MVTTLDFTATTLAEAGGELPPEFDGVNILPRLTGETPAITRSQPMYWDFITGLAIRQGDWKLYRNGSGDRLFNMANDPKELFNLASQQPEKTAELAAKLDSWAATFPPAATTDLKGGDALMGYAISGAPEGVKPDPRYLVPYDDPRPAPYPVRVTGRAVPHGRVSSGAMPPDPKVASTAKRRPPTTGRDFGRMFKRLDSDKDGFVTLQEFIGDRKDKADALTSQFNKRDADKDSRLTLEEMRKLTR